MPQNQLSVESQNGIWFGVLTGPEGQIFASAFSRDRDGLVRRLSGGSIRSLSSPRTDPHLKTMASLYNGNATTDFPPLSLELVTEFQKRVYQVLLSIPSGKVTSYGLIAKKLGSGPRAVGTAVASNPWPLFVPCHRVVPSTLKIGNYSMDGHPSSHGSKVKRELLEREGVKFNDETVDPSCIWNP